MAAPARHRRWIARSEKKVNRTPIPEGIRKPSVHAMEPLDENKRGGERSGCEEEEEPHCTFSASHPYFIGGVPGRSEEEEEKKARDYYTLSDDHLSWSRKSQRTMENEKKEVFFFFFSPIMSFVFGGSYIFFVVCPVVTISLSLSSRMIIDDDCSKLSSSSHFSMTSASVSTFFIALIAPEISRGEGKKQ